MIARVSVVIPVVDDSVELGRLLGELAGAAHRPLEVLVVDGSAGRSAEPVAQQASVRYLTTRAGRGHQLAAGAAAARGDALWFLHADAQIAPDALAQLAATLGNGAAGGCFRFRFRGRQNPARRCLAWLINLRSQLGGIPYGDQGLFASASAYAAAGGFPDQPLFEEVSLVRGLRRRGRFVRLDASIGVSPRRWERDGWLRRTLANRALALAYGLGIGPARLATWYRRR
ncbi:MAG: glycosyltransferase [Gammaproteobacteria bacterium]|nr:glycosyltransferase [Gammaproteobacteria bacterium]